MSFVSLSVRVVALCVLSCLTFAARAELWQGTLGKSAIVADLSFNETGADGQYFYRRHHRVIALARVEAGQEAAKTTPKGMFTLEESSMDAERTSYWRLVPPAGATLNGEWVGGGKRLPIRLRRIDPATLPATDDQWLTELRAREPFRYLQLQGLPLQPGKVETVDGFRLQWWREPVSDVALFRVQSGYPAAQLPAINHALARAQWNAVTDAFDCTSSTNGEYEFSATLDYIGRDALSVALATSYYCGGAHPDFDVSGLNLDPRTGRELTLEDVFWVGKGEAPAIGRYARIEDASRDEAWMAYRGEVLAPWLSKRFAVLYPDEIGGATGSDDGGQDDAAVEDEAGCDYTDPGVWSFSDWQITRKGLRFGAYFPRVMRVCDDPDWAVLPWKDVRAHPGRLRIGP